MSCESFDLDSISQLSLADSSVDIFKSSFANSKSISSDNIPQVKIVQLRVEDLCAQDLHSYTSAKKLIIMMIIIKKIEILKMCTGPALVHLGQYNNNNVENHKNNRNIKNVRRTCTRTRLPATGAASHTPSFAASWPSCPRSRAPSPGRRRRGMLNMAKTYPLHNPDTWLNTKRKWKVRVVKKETTGCDLVQPQARVTTWQERWDETIAQTLYIFTSSLSLRWPE